MKSIEKMERKLNKLITENDAMKANIRAKLEKAKVENTEGRKELDAAAESGDDSAYHKAKDKIRFAEDTIEMCTDRLNALEAALCSKAEYEEAISTIKNETEKAEQTAEKKAASLVAELYKLAQELSRTIDENNRLMEKWHTAAGDSHVQLEYYPKNASEVLFLGNMISKRKNAKKSLQDIGMCSLNIYDSIK